MILSIGKPSPKQVQFLTADTKYVGFGGARGGGKSWSVRTKGKLMALKYPGIKQLIVRRTYPELINNHINQLRVELLGIARYISGQCVSQHSKSERLRRDVGRFCCGVCCYIRSVPAERRGIRRSERITHRARGA